jgi:eukaryotic-like serine/threonine-protein kinase
MGVFLLKEAIQSPYIARFESFEVNLRSGELLKSGERIKLPEQSFQILAMLLERPGEVVMRQEIQKRLWPNDTIVEFENSINAAIKRLRAALDDPADQPRYIETLARRGYRWKIPVEWVERSPVQQPALETAFEVPDYSASRLIGKRISHYRVLEILGGGGMGLVYKAEDIKLGRSVALKFLPEELAGGTPALERFEREARAASSLNDPNICTIYAIEEHEGQPFIAMELLEGQTLRELISAHSNEDARTNTVPFRLEELLDIALQIASGLGAAHKKGIVHRDIKPANVFVRTNGQVKILDFGLAKLLHAEAEDSEPQQTTKNPPKVAWNPYITLTRTGVTIGTAGYMSPEQIRGEKLDARTDLFSFGLVLYEMAAGKRAFSGDTAPVLENAILHQEPTPVRELNREIPAKLETLIDKALEKDREKRYKNAFEMRADLEMVKREIMPRSPFRKWVFAAGAVAALLIGGATFWLAKHAPTSSQGFPDLKLQQLTVNSPENPVSGGSISPDGTRLAYADLRGIHIKAIGSDEVQSVPQSLEVKNANIVWDIGPWFPDSKRFLVHSHPSVEHPNEWSNLTTSIWVVPVLDGPPRKLRDQATAWNVSPDGSWIAFTSLIPGTRFQSGKGMWLMAPDGTQAHRLFEDDANKVVCCLQFFPTEHRVGYVIQGDVIQGTDTLGETFVMRDLNGGPVTTVFRGDWGDGTLLPGGKWLYTTHCDPAGRRADEPCNFWIERVDWRTGEIIEAPRRLTNWFGFAIGSTSASADGKRVTFLEDYARGASYVADLKMGGTQLANLRRVTLEEGGDDVVTDWTADSKTLVLDQSRGDHYQISRQALSGDTPETIVMSDTGYGQKAVVSPDGKWIVLPVFRKRDPVLLKTILPVMRVPASGGTPETIFKVRYGASVFCARPPSQLCVVAETTEDLKGMTVTAFDPVKGLGSELVRFNIGEDRNLGMDHLLLCDLSPDGSRLAVARSPVGPIEIYPLRGQQRVTVPTKGLDPLRYIKWTADGKGLFVSTSRQDSGELLHLDLGGKANLIWKCSGSRPCLVNPAPDGRHVAIYEAKENANIFMMENF